MMNSTSTWVFRNQSRITSVSDDTGPNLNLFLDSEPSKFHAFSNGSSSPFSGSLSDLSSRRFAFTLDNVGTYIFGEDARRKNSCEQAKLQFLRIATEEQFEYGYTPPSERFLVQFGDEKPALVGELIQLIQLTESHNVKVMVSLLNGISAFKYETFRPYTQTVAVAALANKSVDIKEAAIRVYETWGHPEGAKQLENVECNLPWLDSYRQKVIDHLREQK
jgi:hypothetical protein